MAQYVSTKNYGNDRGLSCAFRQHKAGSHCSLIHGYALGFKFTFTSVELDERNWVVDFGSRGCGFIKTFLEEVFDHKTVVASDDPHLEMFYELHEKKVIDLKIMDAVGCEAFAKYVYDYVAPEVHEIYKGRVHLESVECYEHAANSAIYRG